MSPTVSVIIPICETSEPGRLEAAIGSVLGQTYPDFELIVVDDGSRRASAERFAVHGERLRYRWQPQAGTAAARNTGLRMARGAYVALLDHDDLFLPHRLARQVPLLEADPALGLVYAQAIRVDEATGQERVWPRERECLEGWIFEPLFFENVIPAACVLFPRKLAQELGGFDESLRGTDDWELWLRICATHPAACVPEPLARHVRHGANQSRDTTQMLEAELAALHAARRHNPERVLHMGMPGRRFVGDKHARLARRLQKAGRQPEAHAHYREALRMGHRRARSLLNWCLTGVQAPRDQKRPERRNPKASAERPKPESAKPASASSAESRRPSTTGPPA